MNNIITRVGYCRKEIRIAKTEGAFTKKWTLLMIKLDLDLKKKY